MQKRFNVRVYGLLIQNGQLLVNEEQIRDRSVVKLPGGGLHWGEGTHDCLIREWKEELDIDITVGDHFYTTSFFQHSAFDDSQVISIYYLVSAPRNPAIRNLVAGEKTFWLPLSGINAGTFTLPIDKVVGGMIQQAVYNGTLASN